MIIIIFFKNRYVLETDEKERIKPLAKFFAHVATCLITEMP